MGVPKKFDRVEAVLDGRHHLTLTLSAAPPILRFVVPGGDWKLLDALDQPGDEPQAGEEVVVAMRMRANPVHATYSGKDRDKSGWYLWAQYETLAEQPPDEVVRDNDRWKEWCHQMDNL